MKSPIFVPFNANSGHDHRFGQAGADSSAWGRDRADESAPTNGNKMKAQVEAAETMIMALTANG